MKLTGPLSSLLIAAMTGSLAPAISMAQAAIEPTPFVLASGLEGPRGLRFGPDGYLYVAEAGTGGTNSTVGQCTQVPGPPAGPGPDTGGKYYYAKSMSQLDDVFRQISDELRTQYLLAYYPSQRLSNSQFRRIKITVTEAAEVPSYHVRHRAGYYTTKSDF